VRRFALAGLALLALAAPAAAQAPAHKADGKLADWRGTPTNLAGRAQVSRGELIDTDYLYDDYGPDVDGAPDPTQFRANLAPTSGDYRYSSDPRLGYDGADLRETRIAADAKGLHALIALQTLKAKSVPIAMLAIDADGKASTGAAAWPDGVGIADTPGADDFVTVWGGGARLTDGGGYRYALPHGISLRDNALEVDIPWKRLGKLSPRARVWVLVGLAGKGGRFAPQEAGQTAAWDVGFQGAERYGLTTHWGDAKQSHALATQNVSAYAHRLDVGLLRRRATRLFHPRPGFYNRIFRSSKTYGEGIILKTTGSSGNPATDVSGTATPEFRGRYQPYGLYLPKGWKPGTRAPLLLDGHSLDINQNQYRSVGQELPALGDARHSIVITPLARGIDTWYLDAGLLDVFEAWRDVGRHYKVDASRTDIAGYSMGGYMTYRLGLLDPDAFARAAVHVGPPAYFSWAYPAPLLSTPQWQVRGNTNLIVDNGLNLPYEINHGNADELVPITGVVHQADTFQAAGGPYRFYHHVTDDHLSFLLSGDFVHTSAWLGSFQRVTKPVRVRYKHYPSMDLPADGLRFDHAYWVRDIAVRSAKSVDSFGEVDATTAGLGRAAPRAVSDPTTVIGPGAGISPATVTGQHLAPGAPTPRRNAFTATLTNIRSLRLVISRMGLHAGKPLTATLGGDGATTIVLGGDFGGPARLDGRKVALRHAHGRTSVTVDLARGRSHTLKIG
ncbi:MAG TPA: hypothetical protein VGI54_09400, partial [Solirubrobacteraceae bacterium]